jgi:hypothetical protein
MNKKARKKKLNSIVKEAKLNKVAEDTIQDVNALNTSSAEEYAHKVFEALLNNIDFDELLDE